MVKIGIENLPISDEYISANDTDPQSLTDPPFDGSGQQITRAIFIALYAALFVIGMSNLLTLFIVTKFKRMRTVTNVYVFNLSLADFTYVAMLPLVIAFRLRGTWSFGLVTCKLFYIAESTAKYASVYFVCMLTVDRYLALCHAPWCKTHRTVGTAMFIAVMGWALIALLMAPIYLFSEVVDVEPNVWVCGVKWPEDNDSLQLGTEEPLVNESVDHAIQSTESHSSLRNPPAVRTYSSEQYFAIYSFAFCYALPSLAIVFFSMKMFNELVRARKRALERLRSRRKNQAYRKVTRMVLSLAIFYLICWSPFWIISFVSIFSLNASNSLAIRIFFNVIHTMPYLNCAVNPIVYGLLTGPFKEILRNKLPFSSCSFFVPDDLRVRNPNAGLLPSTGIYLQANGSPGSPKVLVAPLHAKSSILHNSQQATREFQTEGSSIAL